MQTFSIGDLSRDAAVKVETIRYYEKIGLMPEAARTRGNHRAYTQSHRDRLTFIRHSRELGFSLNDIRALLDLSDAPEKPCSEADAIAAHHLEKVRSRIVRLKALEGELMRMISACSGNKVADCRVIEALSDHSLCSKEH